MSFTVAEIVEIRYLGTRVHAGASGLGRTVTWAHACEVSNPWNWLDEGDMLMTNGYSLPADAAGQVAFVTALAKAGISAVAIGEQQHAPPLTRELSAAADELGLPILLTGYEVPFIAVARAVADANHKEEQARLLQTMRLYDRLRESAVHYGEDDLTACLGDEIGATLHVLDPDRGVEVLHGRAGPPLALSRAVVEAVAAVGGPLPALTRLDVGAKVALLVPVPARQAAVLIAVPLHGRRPALSVLQHVATIAALQVERMTAEREQARRLGTEVLAMVIDGRIGTAVAQHQLEERGLGEGPLVLVACEHGGGRRGPVLHHRLTDRAIPHLLLLRGEVLLVALPGSPEALETLREELDGDIRLGVSDPFHGSARAPDAAREALWALEAAESKSRSVVHYGDDAPTFMPRTLSDCRALVRGVLGPLLDYDASNGTELVASLKVFLSCNRSWQRASGELFVHKQTLVYRMRRVEELTQRRLAETADVAELWMALRALSLSEADYVAA